MPIKNFPTELKNLIATRWCKPYPAIHIKLSDSITVKYSTIELEYGSDEYVNRLYSVGSVKKSKDKSVDRIDLVLNNADTEVGQLLVDPENALNKAEATLYKIYVNLDDPDEKYRVERFAGVLQGAKYTQDKFVNISILSDAYAGGSVAEYEVRRNCVWQYQDGVNCFYAGNIPDCDLTWDGSNGCINHNGVEGAKTMFGGQGQFLDENVANQVNSFVGGLTDAGSGNDSIVNWKERELYEVPYLMMRDY